MRKAAYPWVVYPEPYNYGDREALGCIALPPSSAPAIRSLKRPRLAHKHPKFSPC